MRPELILHIGQSKTGTSSIQRCLGARREALLAEGVLYPRSPGAANHALLPASVLPAALVQAGRLRDFHPNVWEGVSPEARLARFRQDFAAEMAAMGPGVRRVILSAEQCAGLLVETEEIGRLHELLAPRFASMRVVVYLRRQDQHAASSYAQALRVAVLRPPGLPEGGLERLPGYDYARLLDRWAGVFGAESVTPRIFEPGSLLGGDVVEDFLALCGLALRIPKDDPARQSNLSIGPEGLALVRAMGSHLGQALPGGLSAGSPLWRRFMQSVSEAMPGRGWRPAPEEAAGFMAGFAAVNEAVRGRWLPERSRLFSEDYGQAASAESAPPTTEAVLAAACALLAREITAAQAREAQQATQLGRLQEQAGKPAAARSSYQAALRAVPEHAAGHFFLALLDLAAGDRGAATAHLEVLRRAHPADPFTARLERRVAGA
ncbi:hypothetical protein [Siccirubricoccus sp. G192]|uniref:tetratricopeptide repeat protein n=1 Tax=Siccirubricoccus sp. G192 TaxID=2849651 RepID=UPI001C2BDE50|nr:hypothetical protein [Siccirubricoccus sp. G192]MBV1799400.1 hypothetical protein [Siccirubricoccus sp. G192]